MIRAAPLGDPLNTEYGDGFILRPAQAGAFSGRLTRRATRFSKDGRIQSEEIRGDGLIFR